MGGQWRGPISLGGAAIAPHLGVAMRPDGRLQVFALTLPRREEQGPGEIVSAIQVSVGGASFGPWQSLGNPDAPWLGVPAVAANAAGRLQDSLEELLLSHQG